MEAKHIQIAREQGPEAGLEAYLAAPASKNYPAWKRIAGKKKDETRLTAYCAEFSDRIGRVENVSATDTEVVEDGPAQALLNGLAQLLAGHAPAQIEATSGNDDDEAPAARNAPAENGVVTRGIAWELLGGDPKFEPNTPEAPATNGQLYSLNVQGKLGEAVALVTA